MPAAAKLSDCRNRARRARSGMAAQHGVPGDDGLCQGTARCTLLQRGRNGYADPFRRAKAAPHLFRRRIERCVIIGGRVYDVGDVVSVTANTLRQLVEIGAARR